MSDRRLWLIALGAVVAVAFLRASALYSPGAPAGIDGGNWLAFGTFDRPGMVYPPLVPALFAVVVGLIGPVLATVVFGAATAAAPGVAVLAVLTWAGRPVAGTLSALAVVSSRAIGETAAWGGYPQPIAMACGVAALVALTEWLRGGSRRALVVFAGFVSAVVATSHLVAVPTAGAIVLLLSGAAITSARTSGGRVAIATGLAVAPFLLLAPTYAALFSTLGVPGAGQAGDAERVIGFAWPAYVAVLVAVPLGLLILATRRIQTEVLGSRDLTIVVTTSAAAISWILAYMISGEPRLLHDVAVLAFLAAAALVPIVGSAIRAELARRTIAVLAFTLVVILSATGLAAFPDQVAFYHLLSRDQFRAIEWLADQDSIQPRTILVADERGVPVGWWVEGMVRQEVLFASDFRWLRFESERERARSANALLYQSSFPGELSVAVVRDAGIAFVFLPSSAVFGIDPGNPPTGWDTVFASGDAAVLSPVTGASVQSLR